MENGFFACRYALISIGCKHETHVLRAYENIELTVLDIEWKYIEEKGLQAHKMERNESGGIERSGGNKQYLKCK